MGDESVESVEGDDRRDFEHTDKLDSFSKQRTLARQTPGFGRNSDCAFSC